VVGLSTIQTQLFSGPLSAIAGGVDISLLAASVVAAALYAARSVISASRRRGSTAD
jgi:hypothetical protein